jgi:hypothetical protein
MSDDVVKLYNDMQCGSVYAMIKWLRHPYVCGSEENNVIADLVETEINVRNDQVKDLTRERDALRVELEKVKDLLHQAHSALMPMRYANVPEIERQRAQEASDSIGAYFFSRLNVTKKTEAE